MNITGIRTRLIIGGLEYMRIPEMEIEYQRHFHLSVARVTLPDPSREVYRSVTTGTAMEIHLGYRDNDADVWSGTVRQVNPDRKKDQIRLTCVGIELPLSTTMIMQSWEDETPEAIIRYCVGQAGMTVGSIDATGIVFPRFTASSIPAWQVARQCEHTCFRAFGKDMNTWDLWVGKDGAVNWGDSDESGDVPVIATGAGLISHLPETDSKTGLARVETFLLPGFRRCWKFQLRDTGRGIDEVFRARIARHVVKRNKVRTYIWYGDEYGKF
jgi:hypothetical protein